MSEMATDAAKRDVRIGNSAFSAFLYGALGYVLLTAWNVRVGAGAVLHGCTALCGVVIVAVALRHAKLCWPSLTGMRLATVRPVLAHAVTIANVSWCCLLLALGYVLASCLLIGLITPFALLAAGISFVPWLKIRFCRRHFFGSSFLILAGAGLGLLPADALADPILFPIATWFCWLIATFSLLPGIFTRASRATARASHPGSPEPDRERSSASTN
jgi:hypothetical protein